jgi:hypothetical protein
MKLIWQFLVWLDIEVNDKWFHGRKETISSRVYRRGKQGKCPLCIWLWPWGGREFLFLLVAYDRGNGKTEKEFFLILAMLPVLIVVEVNSI